MSDSAGVMYWCDSSMDKIEKANLNGTGRTVLLTETKLNVHYFAFAFYAGDIYFTDWKYAYVVFFIRGTPSKMYISLMSKCLTKTVRTVYCVHE